MSGHTPGPWRAHGFVVAGGQGELRVVHTGSGNVPRAEARANARLIAAAPDLLEVAKMAATVAAMECGMGDEPGFAPADLLKVARAAIAKAEGTA